MVHLLLSLPNVPTGGAEPKVPLCTEGDVLLHYLELKIAGFCLQNKIMMIPGASATVLFVSSSHGKLSKQTQGLCLQFDLTPEVKIWSSPRIRTASLSLLDSDVSATFVEQVNKTWNINYLEKYLTLTSDRYMHTKDWTHGSFGSFWPTSSLDYNLTFGIFPHYLFQLQDSRLICLDFSKRRKQSVLDSEDCESQGRGSIWKCCLLCRCLTSWANAYSTSCPFNMPGTCPAFQEPDKKLCVHLLFHSELSPGSVPYHLLQIFLLLAITVSMFFKSH